MEQFLCKFSEIADKVSSNALFLLAFNVGLIALWLIFGVDLANIFISIITAEIVLIGAGAARRGNLALHRKLDEMIRTQETADNQLIGLEHKSEREIIS